jgi:hypothetical protein
VRATVRRYMGEGDCKGTRVRVGIKLRITRWRITDLIGKETESSHGRTMEGE